MINPGEHETYRAALEARRPGGGGVCTLLVRRVGERRVQLLHNGVLSTVAELSDAQAYELIGDNRHGDPAVFVAVRTGPMGRTPWRSRVRTGLWRCSTAPETSG